MGGLLKAPKPAPVAEPAPALSQETAAQASIRTEASAEAAARDARLAAAARARRGLPGTIATSARGVLDPAPGFAIRKSLLGE